MNTIPSVSDLLKMNGISHLSPENLLNHLNSLCDYCYENPEHRTRALIKWKEWLDESESKMKKHSLAYLYFFNESHYWTIGGENWKQDSNDWYNYYQERIIYALRKSLASFPLIKKSDYYHEQVEQIVCNLGTNLSNSGRDAEAIKYFQMITMQNPHFHMARGNRGVCLFRLAQSIPLQHERVILLKLAKAFISKVKIDHIVDESTYENFQRILEKVEFEINEIPQHIKDQSRIFSETIRTSDKREKEYRIWALNNRLFLNVLCDAGIVDEAAYDNLAPYKSYRKENNYYHKFDGYFNHLVEEFITARWLLYEGDVLEPKKPHYAEKRIEYKDLGDNSINSLSKGKILASFRICYSIFDKIAFYLNEYLELNVTAKEDLNLRKLWYANYPQNRKLRNTLTQYIDNPNLKALYWLSKDVYYREQDEEIVEPTARDWRKIRNHLTHEFIRVTQTGWDESYLMDEPGCHILSYQELKDKSIHMLQLVRDALVYLSLTVSYEEYRPENEEKPFFGFIRVSEEVKKNMKETRASGKYK